MKFWATVSFSVKVNFLSNYTRAFSTHKKILSSLSLFVCMETWPQMCRSMLQCFYLVYVMLTKTIRRMSLSVVMFGLHYGEEMKLPDPLCTQTQRQWQVCETKREKEELLWNNEWLSIAAKQAHLANIQAHFYKWGWHHLYTRQENASIVPSHYREHPWFYPHHSPRSYTYSHVASKE